MIYTDMTEENDPKRISGWRFVSTEHLVTPSMHGGLWLEPSVQEFCQSNRARYQAALRQRALAKGEIRDLRFPASAKHRK